MANPKEIGNRFERKIAKDLTVWASGKEKPLWYWKIGSSGAQATITHDIDSKMIGDIVAIHPDGMFLTDICAIELKNDKSMNMLDFITDRKRKPLREAWDKIYTQATDAGRFPLLIYHRYNSSYDYLIMSIRFHNLLTAWVGEQFIDTSFRLNSELYITNFQHFLNVVSPEIIKTCFCSKLVKGN